MMKEKYASSSWFERNPRKSGIAIVVVLLVATVLLLEGVLRLTPYRELISGAQHFPQYMVRADEVTGHDLSPDFPPAVHVFANYRYTVFSNRFGCFDTNDGQSGDYILLLGDSFTWGYAPYEDKWGTLLETLVGVPVHKCGVPGFGTGQAVDKGRRTVSLLGNPPGLVIYGYFFNDLEDDYFFPRDTVIDGHLVSLLRKVGARREDIERYTTEELEARYENYQRYGHPEFAQLDMMQQVAQRMRYWLKQHSILARLVRQAITLPAIEGLEVPDLYDENPALSEAWQLHAGKARDLVRFARENGARLLVVLIPKSGDVYAESEEQIRSATEKHEKVAAMFQFQSQDVDVLDLLQPLREYVRSDAAKDGQGGQLYWKDDMHWNIEGNHLAARLVSRHLAQQGLLNQR